MKRLLNISFLTILFFGLTAMSAHRFYSAIYQINYVPLKKMLQITTRIFADDMNEALKKQYSKRTFIGSEKETPEDIALMKKYLSDKFKLTVNGQLKSMEFLSQENENNVLICYFRIKDISKINSLKIENSILTELYPEQQNIIQFNNAGEKKSLLLTSYTKYGMLK
jgi:hypothetical protein